MGGWVATIIKLQCRQVERWVHWSWADQVSGWCISLSTVYHQPTDMVEVLKLRPLVSIKWWHVYLSVCVCLSSIHLSICLPTYFETGIQYVTLAGLELTIYRTGWPWTQSSINLGLFNTEIKGCESPYPTGGESVRKLDCSVLPWNYKMKQTTNFWKNILRFIFNYVSLVDCVCTWM